MVPVIANFIGAGCLRRRAAVRAALVAAMFALPVAAEVPGGHLYIGAGVVQAIPLSSGGTHVWDGQLQSRTGFSLELAYEFEHAFVGLGAEAYLLGNGWPDLVFASVRWGWVFGSASVAPYLSLGLGYLGENVESSFDGGEVTGNIGVAAVLEAGLLLFRNLRFGRVAVSARLVEPFFDIPPARGSNASAGSSTLPLLTFGLRVFL